LVTILFRSLYVPRLSDKHGTYINIYGGILLDKHLVQKCGGRLIWRNFQNWSKNRKLGLDL